MELLDVKRERLREWMNQGFVRPTIAADGPGTKAIFTLVDLYQIAVFKKLVESGMNRRKAFAWVGSNKWLSTPEKADQLEYLMFLDGNGANRCVSYLTPPPWKIEEDLNENENWDIGFIINFKRIRQALKMRL